MISHRDLARTFERLFRRAGIGLAMSEGFHPKAKLSFPSALSLGIAATDEILDVEIAEPLTADEFQQKMSAHLPDGLSIKSTRLLDAGEKKARPKELTYEIKIPSPVAAETELSIKHLLAQPSVPIERDGRADPVDLRAGLVDLELQDGRLRFTLHATPPAPKGSQAGGSPQPTSVRPREVLDALSLGDLEDEGYHLTRTAVVIASPQVRERTKHEKGNAD